MPDVPKTSKPLSELEYLFAQEPTSDAYLPLAEAYLGAHRLVEAMVVIKKGLKYHLDSADGHILLSRVFLAQKKYQKATEEIDPVLAANPDNVSALTVLANVNFQRGEIDQGKEQIARALAVFPDDATALELARKYGVEAQAPAPRPPPPPIEEGEEPAAAGEEGEEKPETTAYGPPPPEVLKAMAEAAEREADAVQPALKPAEPAKPAKTVRPAEPLKPVEQAKPAPVQLPKSLEMLIAEEVERSEVKSKPAPAPVQPVEPAAPQKPEPAPRPNISPARPQARVSRAAAETTEEIFREEKTPPSETSAPPLRDYSTDEAEAFGYESAVMREEKATGIKRTLTVVAALFLIFAAVVAGMRSYAERMRKIDKHLKKADSAREGYDYPNLKEAVKEFEEILKISSTHEYAICQLGHIEAVLYGEFGEPLDRLNKAKEYIKRAKKQKVNHPLLVSADALTYHYQMQSDKAEIMLKEEIERLKTMGIADPLLHGTLGIVQLDMGKLDQAKDNLMNAARIEMRNSRLATALGDCLRRLSMYREAASYYEIAMKNVSYTPAMLGKAQMQFETDDGNLEIARNEVDKVLMKPENDVSNRDLARAHSIKGLIFKMEKKDPESEQEMRKARSLDRENPEFAYALGRLHHRLGDFEKARENLEKARKMNPGRITIYLDMAKVEMDDNKPEAALNLIKDAMVKAPTNPELPIYMGRAYRQMKQFDEARKQFDEAFKLDDSYHLANYEIGITYKVEQQYDKAWDYLLKAVEGYKEYNAPGRRIAETLLEMCQISEARKNDEEAKGCYETIKQFDMSFPPAYYFLGSLLCRYPNTKADGGKEIETYMNIAPNGQYAEGAQKLLQGSCPAPKKQQPAEEKKGK